MEDEQLFFCISFTIPVRFMPYAMSILTHKIHSLEENNYVASLGKVDTIEDNESNTLSVNCLISFSTNEELLMFRLRDESNFIETLSDEMISGINDYR